MQVLKCRRADDELFNLCNPDTIMEVDPNIFFHEYTDSHLCHTNKKRKEINKTMMEKAITKTSCEPVCIKALPYDANSQDVQLIPNTPVICRVTRNKLGICNNEMFTITHIDEQHTTLENEHAKVDMDTKDFQRHFYVAYAITIHKSQGQTYNKPYTIHEWNKLDKRLRYVALSRATKKDYINIMI